MYCAWVDYFPGYNVESSETLSSGFLFEEVSSLLDSLAINGRVLSLYIRNCIRLRSGKWVTLSAIPRCPGRISKRDAVAATRNRLCWSHTVFHLLHLPYLHSGMISTRDHEEGCLNLLSLWTSSTLFSSRLL